MASYQDIETRLLVVESKLDFVMKNFRMRAFKANGLLNADGTPQGEFMETDLLGLYHLTNQGQTSIIDNKSAALVADSKEGDTSHLQ